MILSAMSEETSADEVPYLSCDINGTRYIYKLAPSIDLMKDSVSSEEQNDIVKTSELDNGEESISLVCLNGQVYAIKNGVIEEMNTNESEQTSCHEKVRLISKKMENNETDYITNESIVVESPYRQERSEEQYEVTTEEAAKDLVAEDNNTNVDDFLEVVTAFRCKMCTYLSQDKMQLLDHIQKLHLNSTVDIKVSSESRLELYNSQSKYILFSRSL